MATLKDFSVEEKLSTVLLLQKFDSKLDEIKTLKGELPMEVKDLEDEIEGLQTRLKNIDTEIAGINNFIDSKNNAKKESAALIKKYEKQQDNVKNNREYEAINKEIEMQELEVRLSDKHIRDASYELKERTNGRLKTEEKIKDIEETLAIKRVE